MRKKYSRKGMALSQIVIILFGMIAFSYILGSEIGFVSAAGDCTSPGVHGSSFCYGNDSFGYYTYTVISETTITRSQPSARTYLLVNGQWTYKGIALSEGTDNPSLFTQNANQAVANFKASAAANTAPSTSDSGGVTDKAVDAFNSLKQLSLSDCQRAAVQLGLDSSICPSLSSLPSSAPTPMEVGGAGTSGTGPDVTPPAPTTSQSPWDAAADTAIKKISEFFGGKPDAAGNVIPVHTLAGGVLNIFAAAGAAAGVYAVFGWVKSTFLGDFFSQHPGWGLVYDAAQAAATGFTFGAVAAPTLTAIFGAGPLGLAWGWWGLIAAVVIWAITYHETKIDAVVVSCIPWQAPSGGADCGKCGQNGLPCTTYQCSSLGVGCELLNSGAGEGKPICDWIDQGDTVPPTISFLATPSFTDEGYSYEPFSPPAEYPKDTGVIVKYNGGNIPPYVDLPIGVTNNKVSKCKIDYFRRDNISEMSYTLFGGASGNEGVWGENHTYQVPVFQSGNGSLSVAESGQVDLYVRCESRNGYSDVNAFVIQFNVDQTPDQTAPQIIGTDILDGTPVAMGTSSLDVKAYVQDQSGVSCKWSSNNYDFNSMENSMTCSATRTLQGSFTGTFPCIAHLNGLKDSTVNTFYFLCNDTVGNVATQSKSFTLLGTQSLAITSVSPTNDTLIKDATSSVKVALRATTSGGAKQGQAVCYYSESGNTGTYSQFKSTNSYQHSTNLSLQGGSYVYYIKCIDAGGNVDTAIANFQVEKDVTAPQVVRASHENSNLNIKTNEAATCVYDILDCNYPFDKGIKMSTTDSLTHTVSWVGGRTYYIKCKDSFGNNPGTNTCSAILSSSQI